jgi:hypothetical protein
LTDIAAAPELAERQKIADRIRLELFIREEVKRLDVRKDEPRKGFGEHPLVLLVIGFLLTTGAGSVVTSWWQYEQWSRQQHYRAAQDMTKERAAVMTFTAQSIAQSFTAAEDVLQLFAWDWRKGSNVAALKERAANWTVESRKWRTTEKVLLARVPAAYSDPQTAILLDDIVGARKRLGNDITNLLAIEDQARGHRSEADQHEIDDTSKHALDLVNSVTGKDGTLRKVIQQMLNETRKGDQLPPPQSFWRWLRS